EPEKEAVYRVIRERRDVRRFSRGEIPEDALSRILKAATQAPSVGFMQPWNFILVRDADLKRRVHEAFLVATREAKSTFDSVDQEKGRKYASLKLEGILEAPLNI